jgi:hypothetical protein
MISLLPDCSSLQTIGNQDCSIKILGKYSCSETILRVVGLFNDLLDVLELEY